MARESMAGGFALPYETAFHLSRGELDEVEARLGFTGRAEDAARLRLMRNLRRALRGMSFKDEAARATAERLLGGDEASTSDCPKVIGFKHDELQRLAMFITTVVFNEIDMRRKKFLKPGRKDEVSEIIHSAVYSSLYAHENQDRLASSREFIDAISVMMPRYYQPAKLIGNLMSDHENDNVINA